MTQAMAEDLFTMQQEALRRAREMHARAMPVPPGSGSRNRTSPQEQHRQEPPREQRREQPEHGHEKPQERQAPAREEPRQEQAPSPPEHIPNLLESLFKDKDRTIILALLILLSGEGGDHTLMFALMYLLM